ncbi:hypothetical protein ABGB12_28730 [Actinocorallia sp. B10E7]|uniref:hypothetical protein n=1 Tax=Actinocorallia sp. B10E7 TaxID=3153558 RepID=UPI00325D5572
MRKLLIPLLLTALFAGCSVYGVSSLLGYDHGFSSTTGRELERQLEEDLTGWFAAPVWADCREDWGPVYEDIVCSLNVSGGDRWTVYVTQISEKDGRVRYRLEKADVDRQSDS